MVGVACNLDDQNEGRRHLKQNGYFAHHPGEQQIADLCGAALGCWVEHIGEMRPRPCLEQPFKPLAKREIGHGKQERYADPADAARRIVALQSPLGLTGKACSAAENVLEALAKHSNASASNCFPIVRMPVPPFTVTDAAFGDSITRIFAPDFCAS